jgi:FkbH-like protein
VAAAGATAVDRLLAAAARFTAWSSAVIVVHALHSAFPDPLGPAGARAGPGRGEVLAALNRQLADGLRALPRAYMLDVPDALARRRQGALDNPKLRHLARMRFSEPALEEVARAYAQFVAPITGRTRKCVVVDLDNTLWGGIVGEDGPHGIRLGDTSPGSEFREFQQYLLSLSQRGMLLAINSKNNEADALEVIRSHEAMILRETAFSAVRINWDHKSTNMVSIAEELGIGLDALVFIDDSDNERALMRQALPQVLTVEMPRDPARYRETLERLPELQTMTVTTEDRARTQQYAERRQREQLRVAAQSLDEYLGSLGIVVEMAPASERTLPRVHQLFQRTNQFNLTGRRYELGTLASRAGDPAWRVYTTHVSDRFGDHGLVATAVVRLSADAWEIENLVMSCRVIGYGIENALLARLAADARTASARWLIGEFIPTAKNAPARDFFSHSAFVRDGAGAPSERWRRDLVRAAVTPPPWITVKAANGA